MPSMPLLSRGVHGTTCVHSACEKGGSERSRSPARAGASGGVDPPTEPGMTLWDFNRAEVEERHMGRKLDCEFLLMEIPLTAFHIFNFAFLGSSRQLQ